MIAESSQITEILTVVASVTKFAGAAVGAGGEVTGVEGSRSQPGPTAIHLAAVHAAAQQQP